MVRSLNRTLGAVPRGGLCCGGEWRLGQEAGRAAPVSGGGGLGGGWTH